MHQPVVLMIKLPLDLLEEHQTENGKSDAADSKNNTEMDMLDDTTYSIPHRNSHLHVSASTNTRSTTNTSSEEDNELFPDSLSQATTDNISESLLDIETDFHVSQSQTQGKGETKHKTGRLELSSPQQKEDDSTGDWTGCCNDHTVHSLQRKMTTSLHQRHENNDEAKNQSLDKSSEWVAKNRLLHTAPASFHCSSADESDEEPRLHLPGPYARRNSTDMLLEEAKQAYAEQSLRYYHVLKDGITGDKRELSSPLTNDFSDRSDTETDSSRSSISGFDFSEQTEDSVPRLLVPKLYDKLDKLDVMEIKRSTPEGHVLEKTNSEWEKSENRVTSKVIERVPSFIAHT